MIPQFYAKIQFQGRREAFPLKTNSQDQAAEAAKRIYLMLVAKGWEEPIDLFKPGKAASKAEAAAAIVRVGTLIEAALNRHDIGRRTVSDYCRAFRLIVSQVLELGTPVRDLSRGERQSRQKRIDDTLLSKICAKDVEQWRQRSLAAASLRGPVALRHAKNTLNSTLRMARSLFSPKFLRHLDVGPDFTSPFMGVGFEPRQSMRYHSHTDLDSLVNAALRGDGDRDLEALPPPQLKAFLLAGLAGLRRNEIDKLEWSSFRWDENVIHLKATEYFQPKTEESLGDVDVDCELMATFREFQKSSTSNFVIESLVPPRFNTGYAHYRCAAVFNGLAAWLKKAGLSGRTPLHTLRKEFGSLMCSKFGIYAASRALRHRDIYITSQHYVDTKKRLPPGLSNALTVPGQNDPSRPIVYAATREHKPKA